MKNLKVGTKMTVVISILALTAVLIGLVGIDRLMTIDSQLKRIVVSTALKIELCTKMRLGLLQAIRSGKNAIISTDDQKCREYADMAFKEEKEVAAVREQLHKLIDDDNDADQLKQLADFDDHWKEMVKLEKKMLDLAILNTNVKANKIWADEAQHSVSQLRDALTQLIESADAQLAGTTDQAAAALIRKRLVLATRTRLSAHEMHRLEGVHIATASTVEMSDVEAQMKQFEATIQQSLQDMGEMIEGRDRASYETARTAAADLSRHNRQIIEFSKQNSNLASAALSMNELQLEQVQCDQALAKLFDQFKDDLEMEKETSRRSMMSATIIIASVCSIGLAFAIFVSVRVGQSITAAISKSLKLTEAIARGDLTQRVKLDQHDEIGQLGAALDEVAANLSKLLRGVSQNATVVSNSAVEMSGVSDQLLAASEEMTRQADNVAAGTEEMTTNVSTMAAASEEMSMNITTISAATEQLSVNVGAISSAAEETSTNVAAVAGSIRQMNASFGAIANEVKDGSRVASEAMAMATTATKTMNELDRAAGEINKVTEVIKMIALQTNLLALNATIEATSAGEAGKGFTVVANEIKELANQSAKAAEDIAKKIEGVQGGTREAVSVIKNVCEVISEINSSAARISQAVDSQTRMAADISANVGEANRGVENIAVSIAEVAKGANDMSQSSGQAATAAADMSSNAGEAAKTTQDIAANINGFSRTTRDNTAGAQRVNDSARQLALVAGELKKVVGQFKIDA